MPRGHVGELAPAQVESPQLAARQVRPQPTLRVFWPADPNLEPTRRAAVPSNDFLSIRDFSPQEIRRFLDLARDIKAKPSAYAHALAGKALALIFEKPSLRTRVTFDV